MKNLKHLLMAICATTAFMASNFLMAQTNHTVIVSNFQFNPSSITIEPGDTVTWMNIDGFHNANGSTAIFPGNPVSFSTGSPAGAPWTEWVVFTVEGTYNYLCDIHPNNMQGTVIVDSPEPPCETPYPTATGLASSIQSNGVLISWDPILGSIGCQVRLAAEGGSPIATTISGSEVSEFFIPGQFLSLGTNYTWGVRCGCSQSPLIAGPWASASFSIPGAVEISSSPNPTSDISNVTFHTPETGNTVLEVYDMSGRNVATLFNGIASADQDYRFSLSVADLPEGVYIYRLTTPTQTAIEKFMITR